MYHDPATWSLEVAKKGDLNTHQCFEDPVIEMDSFDADVLLAIAVCSYLKKKRKQRFSVHPINSIPLSQGQFYTLITCL